MDHRAGVILTPTNRLGVGRDCEYKTRCQGKTGVFGKSIRRRKSAGSPFVTEVFQNLPEGEVLK